VDRAGFDVALDEQRTRSRAGAKGELSRLAQETSLYEGILRRMGDQSFLGYETTEAEGTVVAIVRDGVEFEELPGGGEAAIVLDRTPFYGEAGGQVGDQGVLYAGDSPVLAVEDAQKPVGSLIVHIGRLEGPVRVGQTLRAVVDAGRRANTMRNHTATHLLHRALRNTVGPAAKQAGSLVAPEYLRFDFPFDRALTDGEKRTIEAQVREVIRDDRTVTTTVTTMPQAIAQGADAIFGEKYGEVVRMVQVAGFSRELCGGTHCRATGQVGWFFITAERSIGSGLRRIEAVTGEAAEQLVAERFGLLEETVDRLAVTDPAQLPARVAELQARVKELERRIREGGAGGVPRPGELAGRAESVAGSTFVAFAGPFETADDLKVRARDVRGIIGSGVIAFALDGPEPLLFVTVSDDLVARGVSAAELVRAAVAPIEGRGGGRPEMAQARGARQAGLADALDAVRRETARALEEGARPGGAAASGTASGGATGTAGSN